jgi:hypothetical protein
MRSPHHSDILTPTSQITAQDGGTTLDPANQDRLPQQLKVQPETLKAPYRTQAGQLPHHPQSMPDHPEAPQNNIDQDTHNNEKLRLLQINLNKSEKAHLDIINEEVSHSYNIMLIQEPYTTTFNAIRTPANFRPVFPVHRFQNEEQIRSVIWVNRKLDTDSWKALDVPGTNDIATIQLKGPYGTLSIFNIYNDCTHSRNEAILKRFIQDNSNTVLTTENHHMIWTGNFNRHHPLWDDDEDIHLFTQQAT